MTGSQLTAWRTLLKLDKTAAAKAIGLSKAAYHKYETGKGPIPHYVALACAAIAWGLPQWGEPVRDKTQ